MLWKSWKWKWKVMSLSRVRLFSTPWTVAYQAPPSRRFSRQEYWSGLLFPSPGDLPDSGIKPKSPALQADALTSEPLGKSLKIIVLTNVMYVVITLTHTNYMKNSKEKKNQWRHRETSHFSCSLENERKEEDPPSYIPSSKWITQMKFLACLDDPVVSNLE